MCAIKSYACVVIVNSLTQPLYADNKYLGQRGVVLLSL